MAHAGHAQAAMVVALFFVGLPFLTAGKFVRPAPQAHLTSLEAKVRPIYEALPRNANGLPEASGIRYLARRFLSAEHGLFVPGLDMVPSSTKVNSTEADLRAAAVLNIPEGLPQASREALAAVLKSESIHGFSLHEAARVVEALEQVTANANLAVMRKAYVFTKKMFPTEGYIQQTQKMLMSYSALHMAGTRAEAFTVKEMPEEIHNLKEEFNADHDEVPFEKMIHSVYEATSKTQHGSSPSMRAWEKMQMMRKRLIQRQERTCRRFQGVLTSMDHDGTGQVQYRSTYGLQLRDWAFLETPEYLRALGVLQEQGAKGKGPGVLIPNYVTALNSCRDNTMICCPDECEVDILPRVEAAAKGPRATPKQIWSALHRTIRSDGLRSVKDKRALFAELRQLGSQSVDGRLAVHGKGFGQWLHRAFPHTCRKPTPRGAGPLVVDPALAPSAWLRGGGHMPLDPEDVAEIKAHLQWRWGPEGEETDVVSFAARSNLGLDAELRLIKGLHASHKLGGLPVQKALENILNVRVLGRSQCFGLSSKHMLASLVAFAILGLLALVPVFTPTCIISLIRITFAHAIVVASSVQLCFDAGRTCCISIGARMSNACTYISSIFTLINGILATLPGVFHSKCATVFGLHTRAWVMISSIPWWLRQKVSTKNESKPLSKNIIEVDGSTDVSESDTESTQEPYSDSDVDDGLAYSRSVLLSHRPCSSGPRSTIGALKTADVVDIPGFIEDSATPQLPKACSSPTVSPTHRSTPPWIKGVSTSRFPTAETPPAAGMLLGRERNELSPVKTANDKVKLLQDVLGEERNREGLTEKAKLLLDVLGEETQQAASKGEAFGEIKPSFGLRRPPPGLLAPTGVPTELPAQTLRMSASRWSREAPGLTLPYQHAAKPATEVLGNSSMKSRVASNGLLRANQRLAPSWLKVESKVEPDPTNESFKLLDLVRRQMNES